ncbi:OsmC family protein [Flavobacteriaceae bacterium D16]|nr:OsmC family protein [Flavobacteriaceae bacterium D16]
MTSKVTYLGELRTQCQHLRSGNEFITDAPIDNNGKGEAFSPTDTVATALASCMLTVMGVKARSMELQLKGAYADITKHMAANPRRISGIDIQLYLPAAISKDDQDLLERVGNSCPVMQSIHPDIETAIQYHWQL